MQGYPHVPINIHPARLIHDNNIQHGNTTYYVVIMGKIYLPQPNCTYRVYTANITNISIMTYRVYTAKTSLGKIYLPQPNCT
jgi:hypothetical protein